MKENEDTKTPPISLDCVMKVAGLIEQMGRGRQKRREENQELTKKSALPFRVP